MSKNIAEPSLHRQVAQTGFRTKENRQKPGAFHWVTPNCSTILANHDFNGGRVGIGDCRVGDPTLMNSWLQPSPPLELFSFRLHMDGSLETKGHLDASGGAVSGSVAMIFPGANAGEPNYLLPFDQYWHTVITTDDGTTFFIALVFIDHTTGEMTITWPAS